MSDLEVVRGDIDRIFEAIQSASTPETPRSVIDLGVSALSAEGKSQSSEQEPSSRVELIGRLLERVRGESKDDYSPVK